VRSRAVPKEELVAYPGVTTEHDPATAPNPNNIMLIHELRLDDTQLALFSTLTTDELRASVRS
jgi:hypothetical protein